MVYSRLAGGGVSLLVMSVVMGEAGAGGPTWMPPAVVLGSGAGSVDGSTYTL